MFEAVEQGYFFGDQVVTKLREKGGELEGGYTAEHLEQAQDQVFKIMFSFFHFFSP